MSDGYCTLGYECKCEDQLNQIDKRGCLRWSGSDTVAPKKQGDMVHKPNHYARFLIEPITFIEANKLGFAQGNVIKYVLRHDAKNGLEDLMKARRYLDIMIETLRRREAIEMGADPRETWKESL